MPEDQYGYSKENPPKSCMECEWHGITYSPSTGCRSYWADYCRNINKAFCKMHVILRGEYRSLAKHDEDDLKSHIPFECPYFDSTKIFWEMYGRIKMDVEIFVYECAVHGYDYYEYYVYSLPENIEYLIKEIPEALKLNYLYVSGNDTGWFIQNFGEKSVLLSSVAPGTWDYKPPKPI